MELNQVTFPEGSNNIPGVFKMAFIQYSDCVAIPDVDNPNPETSTSGVDVCTVSGNIIMKQGAQAHEIYFTDKTGELTYELQGEEDSRSFKQMFKHNTPNRAVGFAAFLAKVKNNRGLILVEMRGGEKYMLGGPRKPVRVETATGTFGTNAASSSAGTPTFYCEGNSAPFNEFKGKVMIGSGSGGGSGVGATEQVLFAS